MSKQGKRKITVELPKTKDLSNRPSVFQRLGTKKASSSKKTIEHCRQWAQHGTCPYGKNCKFAATHILISPSKQRAANKDNEQKKLKDDGKNRLHSTVVVRSGRSPEGEIDNWDQNDLEYADTDVLEKRRQQLQRELELQLKMDSGGKDMRKDKKKAVSSSSSSRSSSSSSGSSSSSDGSTSSSSSGREARRKGKKGKLKRNSSSSSEGDVPSKKKFTKSDSLKRDRSENKKTALKKDDKQKKQETPKKKVIAKSALGKKSLSPGKKSGGTPPITSKNVAKTTTKHGKSPARKDKKSISPHSSKDRAKERDRDNKEREKEREKDKDRARARSKSPRKARSRSPRRHSANPKDTRRKDSIERSRPVSPKKQVKKDGSSDRHKKRSASRPRDNKDRSLERRRDNNKDKNDDKEKHDRKDRGRERPKEVKRDDSKRRGRDRGLGRAADKGLEKPNKPMERLLPRPEERLAALAAISNRAVEPDKNSSNSKDRQESERGGRKQDRERDRSTKRDRMDSLDREQGDYEMALERPYDHAHPMDHYDRGDDRYDVAREGDRSPGYGMQGRERHFDAGYDMAGPPRGYPEDDERMYAYDDRRLRDRSWEGRAGSMDRERGYMHPRKEWDGEDYRAGGDWGRERHWPMHDPQVKKKLNTRNDWGDKEQEPEGWHHRGHPGPHRGRMHEYGRGMRVDHGRGEGNKRRPIPRSETETVTKELPAATPPAAAAAAAAAATAAAAAAPAAVPPPAPVRQDTEAEDNPIPDDLSEISDDPDDILNREDMVEHNAQPTEDSTSKPDGSENQSTQDTSAPDEKDLQEPKDEDENTNLDFEEISDGELEEERTRAGLGDALGVDWASLVADVRRREQPAPSGGARDRWRPERVLARLGVSVHMAGAETVRDILEKNAQIVQAEGRAKEATAEQSDDVKTEQNGNAKHDADEKPESAAPVVNMDSVHPVAEIQVAAEMRKRQRAVLFGSGSEITRAMSARRDLALRRHLCRLPAVERAPHSRPAPQPYLFHAARALLMQAPVSG